MAIQKMERSLPELFKESTIEISKVSPTGYPVDFQFKAKTQSLHVDVLDLFLHSEYCIPAKAVVRKASALRNKNVAYIQIFQDELAKSAIVKSMILSRLGLATTKFFARELILKVVPIKDCKSFFNSNHLMGYKGAPTVGLYADEKLVCALSYKIFAEHIEIERFCTLLNTSCVGGFSKLVSYLKKFNKRITSFCDLRYSNGRSYEATGFKTCGSSLGWHWTDGVRRYNRLQCKASEECTERENAAKLGWYKIFDAGQRKYIL